MNKAKFLTVFAILFLFSACATITNPPAYYDNVTVKSLVDLKVEIQVLYDSFVKEDLNNYGIENARLNFEQLLAYEKMKKGNEIMVKQIEYLESMFEKQVNDRLEYGPWNDANLENQKQNILEALDIAIETENKKMKSKE